MDTYKLVKSYNINDSKFNIYINQKDKQYYVSVYDIVNICKYASVSYIKNYWKVGNYVPIDHYFFEGGRKPDLLKLRLAIADFNNKILYEIPDDITDDDESESSDTDDMDDLPLILNINSSNKDELMLFFNDKIIVNKILKYLSENICFTNKKDVENIIGKIAYQKIKTSVVIQRLTNRILKLTNEMLLKTIHKRIDVENMEKINDYAEELQESINISYFGSIYILKNTKDTDENYRKIGYTVKCTPEKRAEQWNYELKNIS